MHTVVLFLPLHSTICSSFFFESLIRECVFFILGRNVGGCLPLDYGPILHLDQFAFQSVASGPAAVLSSVSWSKLQALRHPHRCALSESKMPGSAPLHLRKGGTVLGFFALRSLLPLLWLCPGSWGTDSRGLPFLRLLWDSLGDWSERADLSRSSFLWHPHGPSCMPFCLVTQPWPHPCVPPAHE